MRCIKVDGVEDGHVLEADFSVRCYQGDHVYYAVAGIVCMVLYILGIPASMYVLLYRNRQHLHDKGSPKHKSVEAFLGGLYTQCKLIYTNMYV